MAPEPGLWVSREVESRRPQQVAWEVEVLPALVVEAPQSRRRQPVAWEVAVLPALVVEAESEVVDRAPQASRYSDSLFRQPLLFSFLS